MKTTFVIDISEMTNLESQEPTEGQECSVAIFNKSGELLEYYRSVEWNSYSGDWLGDDWLCGPFRALDEVANEGLTFYWSPAPCSK